MNRRIAFALAVAVTAAVSPSTSSHSNLLVLHGRVTNAAGSALSDARVNVADAGRGTVAKAVTNAKGYYTVAIKKSDATYTVSVSYPGLKEAVSTAESEDGEELVIADVQLRQ